MSILIVISKRFLANTLFFFYRDVFFSGFLDFFSSVTCHHFKKAQFLYVSRYTINNRNIIVQKFKQFPFVLFKRNVPEKLRNLQSVIRDMENMFKIMKTKQREVIFVFFSLVESDLDKNTAAVWMAVLLISRDSSSSAEVIKMKSSIANETSEQL